MTEFNKENLEKVIEKKIMENVGRIVVSRAQTYVRQRTSGSGRLAQSIDFKIIEKTVFVGTDTSYAPHVEWGTRPHEILPKDKQALAWVGVGHIAPASGDVGRWEEMRGKGIAHIAKRVMHPGTTGTFFLRDGVLDSKDDIMNLIMQKIKEGV